MTVQPIRNKAQIERIKRILKQDSTRNYLMFVFGINVGLRISDILPFKVKDVVNADGTIRDYIEIKEQKTGKTKRFMLSSNVKKAISDHLKGYNYDMDDYLFQSREGDNKPITRFMAYKILNDAATKSGINDRIGTHTMRKTFGYWAYKQGTDLALLQDIFNHSSQSITLKYIGITQEQKDQVYINLNL